MKSPFLTLVLLAALSFTVRANATPVLTPSFHQDNWEVFLDLHLQLNGSTVTGFYYFVDDEYAGGGKRFPSLPENNNLGFATTVFAPQNYAHVGNHVLTAGYRSDQFDGYLPELDKLTWFDIEFHYTITQPIGGYYPTPDVGSSLMLLALGLGALRLVAARGR